MSEPEDSSVLSRWSRRKRAAREGEAIETEPKAAVPESTSGPADAEAAAAREAELEANRKAAEAVDLTKLDESSDFSVFMKEGVPALLRKQAMAALWRSSPVYANVDGLVDYDADYGSPDLILKTFKSAWQAGRGYLKEVPAAETDDAATATAPATDNPRDEEGADPGEAAGKDVTENADAPDTASDEDALSKAAPQALPEDTAAEEEAPFATEEEPAPRVSLRRRFALE